MRIGRPIVLPMAGLLLVAAGAAHAQGDPEQGAAVFGPCKACHALGEAENGPGPHLVGIFGRKAGSVEGFRYSAALKDSGVVWQDDTIGAFLRDSKAFIPGNRMPAVSLDEEEIADLLAFLHEETGG